MSLRTGSMAIRFAECDALTPAAVHGLKPHALPSLEMMGSEERCGFTTGRHMLDRNVTLEAMMFGGAFTGTMVKASRKVNEAMLRAECRMDEQAQLDATGEERISYAARSEIRRSVHERLLPLSEIKLTGTEFAIIKSDRMVHTGGSLAARDALAIRWVQAGLPKFRDLTPDWLAFRVAGDKYTAKAPADYVNLGVDGSCLWGRDYLTWLWYRVETGGGMMDRMAVMIEGPLVFGSDDGGQVTAIRNGEPLTCAETKAALLAGKKLARAKITLADGDQSMTFTLDADTFMFRGLRLPQGEKLDPVSRWRERVEYLDGLRKWHETVFGRFVKSRMSDKWDSEAFAVGEWINSRRVRN